MRFLILLKKQYALLFQQKDACAGIGLLVCDDSIGMSPPSLCCIIGMHEHSRIGRGTNGRYYRLQGTGWNNTIQQEFATVGGVSSIVPPCTF